MKLCHFYTQTCMCLFVGPDRDVFDRYYTQGGSVCFPSKGVERLHKWQTQHRTVFFLDSLLPWLGFDVQESVNMLCAEVDFAAFTKGRCQLAARDVEDKNSSSKDPHWNVFPKYKILTGTIPINVMPPCEGEEATFLSSCALEIHCVLMLYPARQFSFCYAF